KQLRLGQPAVSKTIAQLEERLGVRLLLRSTHGLSPTEAGRNFYDRAKRAIEGADETEGAPRGAGAALSGRVSVCAPVTSRRTRRGEGPLQCAYCPLPRSSSQKNRKIQERCTRFLPFLSAALKQEPTFL